DGRRQDSQSRGTDDFAGLIDRAARQNLTAEGRIVRAEVQMASTGSLIVENSVAPTGSIRCRFTLAISGSLPSKTGHGLCRCCAIAGINERSRHSALAKHEHDTGY
ncbi:MAG: hypothetical protein AAGF35_06515, partial [Pseudomonadota bacterium]